MKSFWSDAWGRFWRQKLGVFGALIFTVFVLIALYAPWLASSKPIAVKFDGEWYFPLFRYLFSANFFSKPLDLFYNMLGVIAPLFLLNVFVARRWRALFSSFLLMCAVSLFFIFQFFVSYDPAVDKALIEKRARILIESEREQHDRSAQSRKRASFPNFHFDLAYMTPYARLNMIVDAENLENQHARIVKILQEQGSKETPYTLYSLQEKRDLENRQQLTSKIARSLPDYEKMKPEEEELRKTAGDQDKIQVLTDKNRRVEEMQNRLQYMQEKEQWIEREKDKITCLIMPLLRPFHWQDDVGGDQALNLKMPIQELSRLNRQDLLAGILFGTRIALSVGLFATLLQLLIGIPLGLLAGYFAGRVDLVLSRFVEIWESMPAFFMLLLIVTVLETKSLLVIITIIALFSWTSIFRFVRAEAFRQREIPYIEATHALGFTTPRILFGHLLPNAIVPVIALLPFDILGAITREAGLSFLGLGEELSCSWGQLMDEGRAAFPAESALLWPPAIALTLLLLAIAFIGDALISVLNPKERV